MSLLKRRKQETIDTNCPNCGAAWDLKHGLGFCGYCGTAMPEPPAPVVIDYPIPDYGSICTTITGSNWMPMVSGSYLFPPEPREQSTALPPELDKPTISLEELRKRYKLYDPRDYLKKGKKTSGNRR